MCYPTQISQFFPFPLKSPGMTHNKRPQKSTAFPYSLRPAPYALLPILVFIAVFTLYLLTLAPGAVGGDAGEHQFAVPLLGIPHTTGYPLYGPGRRAGRCHHRPGRLPPFKRA